MKMSNDLLLKLQNKVQHLSTTKNIDFQRVPYYISQFGLVWPYFSWVNHNPSSQYIQHQDINLLAHSGYLYYIDGYKKQNRSCQTIVIDIKRTTLKNAIEWHQSHTSEICGLSKIINFTPKKHKIRKIGYFQLA